MIGRPSKTNENSSEAQKVQAPRPALSIGQPYNRVAWVIAVSSPKTAFEWSSLWVASAT